MASFGKSGRRRLGSLLTFEGIEGSGKSTQMDLLADYLSQKGYAVLKTREPGGTPIGNAVRAILLDPAFGEMTARAELYLILAARAQHLAEVIRPAIASGTIVLCDRYLHSTMAYQGYGRGLNLRQVRSAINQATDRLMPRIAFFLDVSVSVAMRRLASRGKLNRIDREAVAFHERVRKGYIQISRQLKKTTRRIDGNRPVEEVAREIRRFVEALHV